MPNPSKRKGCSFERQVVSKLQDYGLAAERVPLSGAVKGGSFEGDIECPVQGIERKLECKIRAREFGRLYGYLGDNYGVVIRDNRCPPLVVLRLEDFAKLAVLS